MQDISDTGRFLAAKDTNTDILNGKDKGKLTPKVSRRREGRAEGEEAEQKEGAGELRRSPRAKACVRVRPGRLHPMPRSRSWGKASNAACGDIKNKKDREKD